MKYPHSYIIDNDRWYAVCSCGRRTWVSMGGVPVAGDGCPDAMLRRIEEMERLDQSIAKASAAAYEAGLAAGRAEGRRAADEALNSGDGSYRP